MEIIIKNFQKKVTIAPARIRGFVRRVLRAEKIESKGEITLCFVNASAIREINLNYRGHNLSTDVITFNLSHPPALTTKKIIADILISTDAVLSNARIYQTTLTYELSLYVVHGLLHLLGYDDESKADRAVMQQRQQELLSKCLSIKARP